MAFDAFLGQRTTAPRKWRRATYTLSFALHGALLLVGAIYSFWTVDELSPPSITVTFLASTPPPPPPPPPPKKKKAIVKPRPTEVVQPRPDQIVQPKEEPPPEEEEDEGVEGGVEGGVPGGVVGSVGESTAPVMVAPNVGTGMRISDLGDPRYKPSLPPQLNRAGMMFWGLFKICVSASGAVTDVKVVKGADPLIDPEWVAKIKLWQYRPYTLNGRPVPFCHPARIEVRSQG
jgi:periplasmic protein TonB